MALDSRFKNQSWCLFVLSCSDASTLLQKIAVIDLFDSVHLIFSSVICRLAACEMPALPHGFVL